MRTLLLSTLVAVSLVMLGCEGSLGFAPLSSSGGGGGGGGGGGPRLLGAPDAGVTYAVDAYSPSAPDASAAPDAYRAPSCTPMCTGRSCGLDGCGGTCGSCATGQTCSAAGQCTGGGGGGTATVTLYGTSSCGYCRQARTFFNANSVAFSDVSTESSAGVEAGFADVRSCDGGSRLSTPTVTIRRGGTCNVMLGWGEAAARMYLGL